MATLPRFFLSLSNKEKEDFMAMKGCKLPQRPKKRAKFIQKSVLLVSPGAWLTDLSQEWYEVREKKSLKKEINANGLGDEKGMATLPRFFLSLSNKEKEDFMAMKGCKLPQRPKKRAKFIQKSILLVSLWAWLTDLSQEWYEVREKKSLKKEINANGLGDEKGMATLPRFFLSLSNKEKEDFMAMKGCKLPQRPKKRAKFIQKSILLVSPGAWLTDLSQERYEVREKKSSKKRRRGLKAMSMESDSE